MQQRRDISNGSGEEGFMLIGAVVLVFLVMLTLSVAAVQVARSLRRDSEVEAIHRGNEYVRAIQLYYRKFGHYPGNVEQLEKSNNIRFLRQKYDDPMTGKPDWRIIHQGEAKTTVKGFFGQPLEGLPGGAGGLGSAASMVSPGATSTVGGSSTLGGTSSLGSTNSGGFSLGGSTSSPSSSSPLGSSTVNSSPGSSSGVSSQSATSAIGGGGAIVGIGSSKSGESISVINEQTTYETWEFLYDPRIEQLKQKAALLGGASSTDTNSLGSAGSMTSPTNSSNPFSSSSGSGSNSSGSSSTTPH